MPWLLTGIAVLISTVASAAPWPGGPGTEIGNVGGVVFQNLIPSPFGRDDLSGLHYEPLTERLYAVHDSFDVIVEMDASGTFVREFDLPPDHQEGVALAPSCPGDLAQVFISDDAGDVWRYDSYGVECAVLPVPSLAPGALAALATLLLGIGAGFIASTLRGPGVRSRSPIPTLDRARSAER